MIFNYGQVENDIIFITFQVQRYVPFDVCIYSVSADGRGHELFKPIQNIDTGSNFMRVLMFKISPERD